MEAVWDSVRAGRRSRCSPPRCAARADGPPEHRGGPDRVQPLRDVGQRAGLRGGLPDAGHGRAGIRRHRMPARRPPGSEPRTRRRATGSTTRATAGGLTGTEAVFVTSPALRTPMGGGVVAYGDRTAAEGAPPAHGGVVPSLAALLATGKAEHSDTPTNRSDGHRPLAAAGLVAYGATLPLWSMTMRAPQYPKGLRLEALRQPDERGRPRTQHPQSLHRHAADRRRRRSKPRCFRIGIARPDRCCACSSPLHRWLRGARDRRRGVATPLVILADLQWRLYEFGHTLNPKAPIRLKPFTPLVIGETEMGNFESWGMVSWGFWCIVGGRRCCSVRRRFAGAVRAATRASPGDAARCDSGAGDRARLSCWRSACAQPASRQPAALQSRIDAAPRGGTVVVAGRRVPRSDRRFAGR